MPTEKRKRGRPRKVVGADVEAVKPKRGRPRKSALANPPAGIQKRRGRPQKNPLDNPEVKKYLFISATGSPELQAEVANLRLMAEKRSLEKFLAEGDSLGVLRGSGDATMKSAGGAQNPLPPPTKQTHISMIESLFDRIGFLDNAVTQRLAMCEKRLLDLEEKVG